MALAVSIWRHAIGGQIWEIPGRCRYGARRGGLRRDRWPGERSRPGERHPDDGIRSSATAGRDGSASDASAVARADRGAAGYGQPADDAGYGQPAAA
jgi:hypothetical protein